MPLPTTHTRQTVHYADNSSREAEDVAADRLLTKFPDDHELVAHMLLLELGRRVPVERVAQRARKLEGYRARLAELLKKPTFAQRTPEWYAARRKVVTASELLQAIGSRSSRQLFLARKVDPASAPDISRKPAIRHGVVFEDVAARLYCDRNNVTLHEFGLLPHHSIDCFAASPDGITSNGIMLEIKCPFSRQILPGKIKPEYAFQMAAQLSVADLDECDFAECDIKPYASAREFEEDTADFEAGAQRALTARGVEKGAVAVDPDTLAHEHCDARLATPGVLRWAEQRASEGKDVVFWWLKQYSCVRVYRLPSFVTEVEPLVRQAFAEYTRARENGAPPAQPRAEPERAAPAIQPFAFTLSRPGDAERRTPHAERRPEQPPRTPAGLEPFAFKLPSPSTPTPTGPVADASEGPGESGAGAPRNPWASFRMRA